MSSKTLMTFYSRASNSSPAAIVRGATATANRSLPCSRFFSSPAEDDTGPRLDLASKLLVEPNTIFPGLTRERVEKDPYLAEFLFANHPNAFDVEADKVEDMTFDEQGWPSRFLTTEENFAIYKQTKGTRDDEYYRKYPCNFRPIKAWARDPAREEGTYRSRILRARGWTPGILYGADPSRGILECAENRHLIKTPAPITQGWAERFRRNLDSKVFELTYYESEDDDVGTKHIVTPTGLGIHPLSESLYNMNYQRYHAGVPLNFILKEINEDESVALRRDAYLVPIRRYVECTVEEGADVPDYLEVECAELTYKDCIRLDRVILPDGVKFTKKVKKMGDAFIIAVVFGRDRENNEDSEQADGEEGGEEK